MPARPTGTQPTGSVAPTTRNYLPVPSSAYADFFMGSIWEWTPTGIARVNRCLRELNVDRPTYTFDGYLNIWQVRCPRDSEVYIRRKFVDLLSEIEAEYLKALNESALPLVQEDGTLPDSIVHPDVRLPISLPRTPKLLGDQNVPRSESSCSFEKGSSQNDNGGPPQLTLVVPDELRDAKHIVVWQDLQGRNKDFEGTAFASPAARAAIESAFHVKMVQDPAQKVIFIGNAATRDDALQVSAKLTKLLQEHETCRRVPNIAHHIFFVESKTPYTIDTREITWLNPVLPRSTILDPWKYSVPAQYKVFEKYAGVHDAGVFALRVCLFAMIKNGISNKHWSLFGPYAKNVFDGRKPTRSSRFFNDIRAVQRSRIAQDPAEAGSVGNWLEDLSKAPAAMDATTMPTDEIADAATPTISGGEDDPVPLNFDPSRRYDSAVQIRESPPLHVSSESVTVILQPASLLDQQDAVLRDPSSKMRRALKPSRRVIKVDDPDFVRVDVSSHPSVGGSKPITNDNKAHSSDQELGMFNVSICRLMEHVRARYGPLRLRAELGRYYACNLPTSGRAANKETQPANGWLPDDLRGRLEASNDFLFTKALSSWGNDADFLGAGLWQKKSGAVFFDFRFQAILGATALNMVLEVNAEDYTWKIRSLDNTSDVVYVHCLAQHWGFQVSLTHDRILEYEYHWANFAEALVASLQVKPPELEFQHTFDEAPVASRSSAITIQDVRARQVCRFVHQTQRTYLDITRILPTKVKPSRDPKYRLVRGVLTQSTDKDPCAGDNQRTGEFAQWFEASLSSVRMEELLKQNEDLVPGDEVDWTVLQLIQEGLISELYFQAAEVVKGMDGVGVACNNGHEKRRQKTNDDYEW